MTATTLPEVTAIAVAQEQPTRELAGPLGSALQALKSGATIEQMQGLLALQKDWEANEARKAFVADMAMFKLNPPEIFKRKHVSFTTRDGETTSYAHATIGDVTSLTVAGLAEHGFSHRWDTQQQDGRIIVTCILTHRLGHSESTKLDAAPDNSGKKNSIQQMASAVTYLQRYTLLAACGLATKDAEDDDGAGTGERRDTGGVDDELAGEPHHSQPRQAEPPPALLQAAKAAAAGGMAAYQKFWADTGTENRKLLAASHNSLKQQATDADAARTVDSAPPAAAPAQVPTATYASVLDKMVKATNVDALSVAADWIAEVPDDELRAELTAKYNELLAKLTGGAA